MHTKKALEANSKQQRKNEARLPLEKHLTFRGKFSADLHMVNVADYSQLKLPCSQSEEIIKRTRKKAVPMRHYIEDMRKAFRHRLTAGYIYDDVLLREEQYRADQLLLAAVYRRQTIFKELFERFLEEDHADTMAMMDRTEEAQRQYAQMEYRQRQLADDLGILQRQVYILEEIWASYKVYQNFLYQVSPSWWRKDREPIRLYSQKVEDEFEDGESVELETRTGEIVSIIEKNTTKNEKKELYFTDPLQLLAVFEAMEIQTLNSLLHSEELSSPLDTMTQVLSKIKVEYEKEESQILDMLADLESNIVWEEKRAENLERDARQLLNGKFKDLLGHEDIIMLYVCVEDAYESCIGANDDKLSMHLMMKVLEVRYSMQLLELESLPTIVVDRIEKAYYWEEARRMRKARWALQEAQRIAHREEGLSHALRPPPPRPSQPPKAHRSTVSRLVRKARPKPPSLTQEQIDFLTFFTDFCQHTDSPADVLEEIQKLNEGV